MMNHGLFAGSTPTDIFLLFLNLMTGVAYSASALLRLTVTSVSTFFLAAPVVLICFFPLYGTDFDHATDMTTLFPASSFVFEVKISV